MTDVTTHHAGPAVRASDAEREQTVALLQRNFADGRLTQAELEERASAAYAARTRAQLRDLTADLPAADAQPPPPGRVLDQRLSIFLLCVCPPACVAYWLLSLRETALLRAWLMNARPWRQLLAGAIVTGAGVALDVLSHLAGAVLVSAGVIFALPAISAPLHRAWAIARRAFLVRGSRRHLEDPGAALLHLSVQGMDTATGRFRSDTFKEASRLAKVTSRRFHPAQPRT
jgi:Domain of unknown function (DUF1707)